MPENSEVASIEDILAARQVFRESLAKLCKHLAERLRDIGEVLEHSAKQDPNRRSLYETLWKPRIRDCEDRILRFARRAEVRPSICVMGKTWAG